MSGKRGLAKSIWKMENIHRSPYSYAMNINEIQRVFTQIELKHEQLMGIYHSHPTDRAYPSPEDVLYNNYPNVVHIIVSLAFKKPVVRAFRFEKTKIIPYQICVTDD